MFLNLCAFHLSSVFARFYAVTLVTAEFASKKREWSKKISVGEDSIANEKANFETMPNRVIPNFNFAQLQSKIVEKQQ